jgi:RNA polymerase-binding transcription factor DksA
MAPTTKASAKAKKAPAKAAKKATTASKATSKKAAPAKKAAATAKKSPAKAAAKKAPAKKAPAKKAPAKSATKKAPAKQAAAKKAPATKAPAKKATPSPTRVIPALAKRAPSDSTRKPPPKRKGPLDKFLLGQLEALNEERVTYLRQAESLRAEADLLAAEREPGDVQFDEESGEGDTLAVERERDLALSAQASAAVEEIDRAIAKLRDGTYGVCEQCYSTIPKERLRALPYAALCVQCKSAGFARR